MKINKEWYRDKLYACWLGKNIGGTLGAPYEGTTETLDIKGYKTKPGEPMPNDDLDLQLLWLYVLECEGAQNLNQNMLAEYWIDWIPPNWNEYGIAKANLRDGFLPPLSGEIENTRWQTSNGAWIRSEIWAAMAPFSSNIAMKYAAMDAMVDHGISEGTYAEMFTAALQSAAYYESDIRKLLDIALAKIPAESRIAKAVRLVIECYEKGEDYLVVREKLVEQSKDIGMFQAPANIGFVVIGLLYGEGDFKKSLIYTVNCGDDTDCTGATVGATLGIIGGTKAIPDDWREYIGDRIVMVALNGQGTYHLPQSCTELTDRVIKVMPSLLKHNGIDLEFTDGETEIDPKLFEESNNKTADEIIDMGKYSYEILNYKTLWARVEIFDNPRIAPNEKRRVKVSFFNNFQNAKRLKLEMFLPDGWNAELSEKNIMLEMKLNQDKNHGSSVTIDIQAGENTRTVNYAYLQVTGEMFVQPVMIPIILAG